MKMLSALANANRSENTKFRWYYTPLFLCITFLPSILTFLLTFFLTIFLPFFFFPYFLLYWITHFHTYLLIMPPIICILSYLPYNLSDSSSSELYHQYFHRSIRILNASFQSKVVAVDGGKSWWCVRYLTLLVFDIYHYDVLFLLHPFLSPPLSPSPLFLPQPSSPLKFLSASRSPIHTISYLPYPFSASPPLCSIAPIHLHSTFLHSIHFYSANFNLSSSNSTSLISVPLISSLFSIIRNANDGSGWVSGGARIGQSERLKERNRIRKRKRVE